MTVSNWLHNSMYCIRRLKRQRWRVERFRRWFCDFTETAKLRRWGYVLVAGCGKERRKISPVFGECEELILEGFSFETGAGSGIDWSSATSTGKPSLNTGGSVAMDTRTCTDLLVLSQAQWTPVNGNEQEFGHWHCMSGKCHMTEKAVRTGCEMQGGTPCLCVSDSKSRYF